MGKVIYLHRENNERGAARVCIPIGQVTTSGVIGVVIIVREKEILVKLYKAGTIWLIWLFYPLQLSSCAFPEDIRRYGSHLMR